MIATRQAVLDHLNEGADSRSFDLIEGCTIGSLVVRVDCAIVVDVEIIEGHLPKFAATVVGSPHPTIGGWF